MQQGTTHEWCTRWIWVDIRFGTTLNLGTSIQQCTAHDFGCMFDMVTLKIWHHNQIGYMFDIGTLNNWYHIQFLYMFDMGAIKIWYHT